MCDLSIVIVSWNVCALLQQCLHSIYAGLRLAGSPSCEIIVVDNVSSDATVEMVRAEFPSVHLIVNEENRGYPGANNQGLAIAQGRYQMILNPDTEIVGDALATMVAYADANPDVGVIGPQLLWPRDADGPSRVQSSRRRFPTATTAVFESTWLQPYAPRRVLERYYVQDQPDDATIDVDWVKGAAVMVRRAAVEQVGLMDDEYFMYSEELDWCKRFKDAGWRVVYLPAAQIVHHEGKSSEQVVTSRHIHFHTSKVRYFRKHHGRVAGEMLRWFLLANYVWQLGLEGTKWLIGHKRALRAERVAAYRQVLRSRLMPTKDQRLETGD
jgi:N-acetylglucosaminyl-diphospho-decaprenol L-rhamnosyltransferase